MRGDAREDPGDALTASAASSSCARLGGEQPRTLDEVGRTFNVTRERIRQIENQSLKKLRALADSHSLRDVA
jgi:DNA-directed RNA polymerase sigma subunit (sigma70/sigma32)